jgi:hypothetical protein
VTIDRRPSVASAAGVEPSFPEPATGRRFPGLVVLLSGLLGGLVWGIDARVWMRFISTDPEFTWTGTLFIVIGFGIGGLAQAGAYLGRRAGLRRSRMTVLRVAAFAGMLPLGMAAGGPMFPTVVLAPLAITHTEWSGRMRLLVGVIALLPVLAIAAILSDDLSALRAGAGFLWFLVVYAGIVWAARFSLAPQLDGWRAPRAARVIGVAALTVVTVLEALFLVGPKA